MTVAKRWLRGVARILTAGGLLLLTGGASLPPKAPGLSEGRLRPCPARPNCVCSETPNLPGSVEPWRFAPERGTGAWGAAQAAVEALGGRVEQVDDRYLWATFRSRFFRFVDDLELRFDEAGGVIHVRSAARLGYSDFGVNRKRVEALHGQFFRQLGVAGQLRDDLVKFRRFTGSDFPGPVHRQHHTARIPISEQIGGQGQAQGQQHAGLAADHESDG